MPHRLPSDNCIKMDPFVDVFLQIDLDCSGRITTEELEYYVKNNNLDPVMIEKWRDLFDPENTGVITLETFCDTLGLHPAEVIKKREAHQQQAGLRLGSDVHVIYENMPLADQVYISDLTRDYIRRLQSDEELRGMMEDMKRHLDEHFGASWQVAAVDGGYWITHTYLPGTSFQFVIGERAYMFWKIPE
ncbi:hypothetical protein PHET_01045 [Paragonimus heterotremus]|uniref:EF-hand domain-containing protein n=1 Tax=Paragonimus heterotremus TaxID=100268 RepID=A0A8J4WJG2_9TREM|nr:hypothetical protein PHET_01045 [Paragonimus heterotremus]